MTIAVVAMVGMWRMQKLREIDAMRGEYPLVSIRDRLPVEDAPLSPDELARALETWFEDPSHVDDRARQRADMRAAALQRLHSEYQREFEAAPGFGVVRMWRVPRQWAVLSPAEPPAPLPQPPEPTAASEETGALGDSAAPGPEVAEDLHRRARGNFLSPESFGYVQDVDHVAGFVPHAFRLPFDPVAGPVISGEGPQKNEVARQQTIAWKVTTLQLVSLLRFETSRVYETREFPDMGRLRDVPTRPLDDFERGALSQLNTREVVTEFEPNRIQMLGALRASKACVACHQVRPGTLLGAFRYVLSRFPAVAEAKPTL